MAAPSHAAVVITMTPDPLPLLAVGSPYVADFDASGGNAPYWFGVTAGRLPEGIAFDQEDRLSGTPALSGPVAFTLTALDADGRSAELATATEVNDGVPSAIAQSVEALEDMPLPITLTGSDPVDDPLAFTIVDGSGPTSGTLSGTAPDLVYQPAADVIGNDSFRFTVSDGERESAPAQIDIVVVPVNDAPSFVAGADQFATSDASARSVAGWASLMSPGPADETGQQLAFAVVGNSRPGLFLVPPAVASDGTLTYTTGSTSGVAVISLELRDDGGTDNGGIDRSAVQAFSIAVQTPGTDLSIDIAGPAAVEDGGTLRYQVTVDNAGPVDATGATVDVALPPEAVDPVWTCVPGADASCTANGSGDIVDIIDVPANASVVYDVEAIVVFGGNVTISAAAQVDASLDQIDPDPTDNTDALTSTFFPIFRDGFEDPSDE